MAKQTTTLTKPRTWYEKTPSGGGCGGRRRRRSRLNARRVWVAVVRSGAGDDGRGGSGELVATAAAGGERAAGVFRRCTRTRI